MKYGLDAIFSKHPEPLGPHIKLTETVQPLYVEISVAVSANITDIILSDTVRITAVRFEDLESMAVVPVQTIKSSDPDEPELILIYRIYRMMRQPMLRTYILHRNVLNLKSVSSEEYTKEQKYRYNLPHTDKYRDLCLTANRHSVGNSLSP